MNWIFLRGLTREARHWGGFVGQFEACLSPMRITTQDLPGTGKFHQQTSPLRVADMVMFARQQLLAQGIKPPYALLGMSLGAMVCTDWAQRFEKEISCLVLINTSMRPHCGLLQRLRPGQWLPLLGLAANWGDGQYAERSIHHMTCNQLARRDDDLAAWLEIRRSAPVSKANALRQLLAAARFACAAQTPRCPALVLSSGADQLVNPICSTQLAGAWQAALHTHPWAGHDLPHDDGLWLCERITEWFLLLKT